MKTHLFPSRRWFLALLLLFFCAPPRLLAAGQGNASQVARPTSTPYTGDLSHFDYPDRGKKLQINRVMDLLAMKPGSNVADIGAGGGWFTVRAAARVAPSGVVYAEDINPDAIAYIRNRVQRAHIGNVREVLGHPDDPMLPANSLDAVLLLKSYHEVAQPITLLKKLRKSLRSGARLGIIDRNGNGADHGVQKEVVIKEAGEAGYKLTGAYDFVKPDHVDYFLVFQPD